MIAYCVQARPVALASDATHSPCCIVPQLGHGEFVQLAALYAAIALTYGAFDWLMICVHEHSSVTVMVHVDALTGSEHVFAAARAATTFARSIVHVDAVSAPGASETIASTALASPVVVASTALASLPPSVTSAVVQSYEHAALTPTSVAIASEERTGGMDSMELTRRIRAFNRAWIMPVW